MNMSAHLQRSVLPPKRPYFAQDSGGYITSSNDIPLLSHSLVIPLPLLSSPRHVPGHEALIPHSLLPEIAGYTTIIFAPLPIFSSRCHVPLYILTPPFHTLPLEQVSKFPPA